jgi:DNA helicase II / ATP-dependent DNA helicase PcrA
MDEFENLQGFLEHISLVMDTDRADAVDSVSIMTLHSAKGLEFETVFLPGWEEGLLPHQRSLDDQGRAGLEEERRLAHVGITRARRRAKIYFATNRRMHGSWSTNIPSRFLDELPEEHVAVTESKGGFGGYGGYASSRFDAMESFGSSYTTPGWQRAQARRSGAQTDTDRATHNTASDTSGAGFGDRPAAGGRAMRAPLTIEGELVAKSTGAVSLFGVGDRVFHQKFGNGNVTAVDGNKLTIQFDKAGEKRVVDSFLARA